jgi:hypothetical protein
LKEKFSEGKTFLNSGGELAAKLLKLGKCTIKALALVM